MATEDENVTTPPRVIRDKAFAQRLDRACDLCSQVPPYN